MKKVVLITGATGGIGIDLSKSFKKSGWYVIGLDIKEPDLAMECDDLYDKFLKIDLSFFAKNPAKFLESLNVIKSLIKNSGYKLGGIINNAAVQIIKPFEDIEREEWNNLFSVNFFAPVELSKYFIEDLKQNNGSILNIGSIHRELTKPFFSAYAASKSALIGLTQSLAVEFGDKVRVNAIEPAAINTSMLKSGFKNNPNKLKTLASLHPTKYLGETNDISKAALFLMNPEQKFINGSILKISGGIHCKLNDIY